MNFMYFFKLLILFWIKLDFVMSNHVNFSYSLYNNTFSFWISFPFLAFYWSLSLSLYNSWILLMLLSIYSFSCSLQLFSSSASIFWIWYILFSILLWTRFCKSLDMLNIFVTFIVQWLLLAFRIVLFIFVIVVLVSSTILTIFQTCLWISIIISILYIIL